MIARGAVSAARTTSSETPRLRDLVASLAPFFSWRASADESLDRVSRTGSRSPYAGKTGRGQGFPARGQRRPGARLYCVSVLVAVKRGVEPTMEDIPAPFSSAIVMDVEFFG